MPQFVAQLLRSWWPTAIVWLVAASNIAVVVWSSSDGQIDLLWTAIITLVLAAVCWALVARQLWPQLFVVGGGQLNHDVSLLSLPTDEKERLSRTKRRERVLASIGPALLVTIAFFVLVAAAGSRILARARCVPIDGAYFTVSNGLRFRLRDSGEHINAGTVISPPLSDLTPTELAPFASSGLAIKFRLERAPNVYKCEITAIRLTVLEIDHLFPTDEVASPVGEAPMVWVVQIPKDVVPGQSIDAIPVSFTGSPTDNLAAHIEERTRHLASELSQPCILRITSQAAALYKVKVDVYVEAGWRSWFSNPIEVCNGQGISIYRDAKATSAEEFPSSPDSLPESLQAPEAPRAPEAPSQDAPSDDESAPEPSAGKEKGAERFTAKSF